MNLNEINFDSLVIDKQNGNIAYNDAAHVYWNIYTKEKHLSVTTLVGQFEQPYDKEFWSSYKALEALTGDEFKTVKPILLKSKRFLPDYIMAYQLEQVDFDNKKQEILDAWTAKNKQSCDRGTAYHLVQENLAYESNNPFIKDHIAKDCDNPFEKFVVEKDNYDLMSHEHFICPEYLAVYSKDGFLLAGQSDIVIRDGNYVDILDYKTNEKMDMKSFYNPRSKKTERMKFPLAKLDDCNYIHYCLQLSVYAYMIKMQTGLEPRHLKLIHHDHNGVDKVIPAKYLEKEVIAMFKQGAMNLKIKRENERLEDLL